MAPRIKVRAYSSSANLGPGFDVLAVALDAFFDEVELRVENGSGRVLIEEVSGPYASEVRSCSTALGAVEELKRVKGIDLSSVDVFIRVFKGVPVGRGLGSSGATAAATVIGLAKLLGIELSSSEAVYIAGLAEAYAAGSPHFDNVAASILGKLVVVGMSRSGLVVKRIDLDAWFALIVPMKSVIAEGKTKVMREVLPRSVELGKAVANWSRLAILVASASQGDLKSLGEMMELDEIVEPARSKLIPCYNEVKEAAKKAGCLGVAISGAGPSMIALAEDQSHAKEIAEAMASAYTKCGEAMPIVARTAPGAYVV